MSQRAPLAMVGYSVGIVGHRAERISDPAGVGAQIGELLGTIDAALAEIGAQTQYGEHAPPRLVSALAEGADRLAAHAALERALPIVVVLPFPAAEYERDFADAESRQDFQMLLARSEATIVLDGDAAGRERAYDAAGMALLDNCDLLIAVWDGEPGRGRGGTREVIEEAARRAMPVVVVPSDGTAPSIRSAGAGAAPMRFDDVPTLPLSQLPTLVSARASGLQAAERAGWQFLADLPPAPLTQGAYPLLLRLAGVGPKKRRQRAAPAATEDSDAITAAFRWWDAAAIRAAQAFRSAVIVNFGLAALAVVLAAISVLGGHAKWVFVLAEVVTILSLLGNSVLAGRRRWQERWLESREVAELLRVAILLRHVGIGRGIANPDEGGWIGHYAGAFARSAPLRSVDLSNPAAAAQPLIAEVADQMAWNEATARRMHLAAHRIERFGEVLFGTVLAAAIAWLALHFAAPGIAYPLQYPLTALTAGLPAVATASYGIRVILDFEGIAERSHRIASGLNALLARWSSGPENAAALQDFGRRAADIMLADVAAWRLLAEGRRLTIPG